MHLMQTQLLFKLSPEELCNVTVSADGKSSDGSEGVDQTKSYLKKIPSRSISSFNILLSRLHPSPERTIIICY